MKINLTSPINKLGYGYVGLNFLKTLIDQGHEVSLNPIGQLDYENSYKKYISRGIINEFDINAPHIIIWHHFDLEKYINKDCKAAQIGFPIFETNKFSEKEIANFNSCDIVFVTCNWYKKIIEKIIKPPVHIINLGFDPEIFIEKEKQKNNKIRFLNVGKWEIRKGHDFLPKVFNEAFNDIEDVELIMLCLNPFLPIFEQNAWFNLYENILGAKVKIIKERLTNQTDVVKIMNEADAGIFPARAEGWNLELLEMMAMNKPVIATNYSAHTEFCNKNNCYLININEEEYAYDGYFFNGISGWAKLGLEQEKDCIEYLRIIYRDIKNGKQFNIRNSINKFSWANAVNNMINIFNKND